jgi:hypothetical protein
MKIADKDFNLNVQQICSITVWLKKINKNYEFKKQIAFFGIILRKEFYSWYGWNISKELIMAKEGNCYFENNRVYYFPYIEVKMADGTRYDYDFKTENELCEFMASNDLKATTWI